MQVRDLLAWLQYSSTNARLSWATTAPSSCHSGMAGLITERLSAEAHNTPKRNPSYTQGILHGQISDIEPRPSRGFIRKD